ncbi:MAG: hypothetical protein Kow0090_00900 [Myxococcota bacterium]
MSSYFLIVETISPLIERVEPYVKSVSDAVGIDEYTARQRLCGRGLVAVAQSLDKDELKKKGERLRLHGMNSTILTLDDIKNSGAIPEARGISLFDEAIDFKGNREEGSVSFGKNERLLLVAASFEPKKGLAALPLLLSKDRQAIPSDEELLKRIAESRPALFIYSLDSGKAARFDAARFNFSGLGELNRLSRNLNFLQVVEELKKRCRIVKLDLNFDRTTLPGTFVSAQQGEEAQYRELSKAFFRYCRYFVLAAADGLFQSSPMTAMAEGGVGFLGAIDGDDEKVPPKEGNKPERTHAAPPLPPFDAAVIKPTLAESISYYGPPWLFLPLGVSFLVSVFIAAYYPSILSISVAALLLGLFSFLHSLVLIKRKRLIENAPTSKVRSMAMGFCELSGRAKPIYDLRSPFSLLQCVYYKITVRRQKSGAGMKEVSPLGSNYAAQLEGMQWIYNLLKGRSHRTPISTAVPFYLEDDTGRVQVFPKGAIFNVSTKFRFVREAPGSTGEYTIITEEVIPTESPVYVMGYVKRRESDRAERRRQALLEKLREIKLDPAKLEKFDINKDGKIDEREWEIARQEAEREVISDELLSGGVARDEVVVSSEGAGGMFYIADQKESQLLFKFKIMIPLSFVFGIGLVAASLAFLLASDELLSLMELFQQ